jgi:hypothetical protein
MASAQGWRIIYLYQFTSKIRSIVKRPGNGHIFPLTEAGCGFIVEG